MIHVLAPIAATVVSCLCRSLAPVREEGSEFTRRRVLGQGERVIFAFWHNRLLYMIYHLSSRYVRRGHPLSAIASPSRDGERLARVIARFGGGVVRGSTGHDGLTGFREMLRRSGRRDGLIVTPDGPRGPRYRVQDGVIAMARLTGLPIVPVTYGALSPLRLRSWDRFLVPRPHTAVRVLYGDPVWVGDGAGADEREAARRLLEERLTAITRTVDGGEDRTEVPAHRRLPVSPRFP